MELRFERGMGSRRSRLLAGLWLGCCACSSGGDSATAPDEEVGSAGAHGDVQPDAADGGLGGTAAPPGAGDPPSETSDAAERDAGLSVAGDAATPSDAGEAPLRSKVVLAVPDSWQPVPLESDPFEDPPESVRCDEGAVAAEYLGGEFVLGVDTGGCNYLTMTQPIRSAVPEGATVVVRVWHFALTAPAPATAHVAILLDGLAIVDERVEIPHEGQLIKREVQLERTIASGAPAHFHLHNHGENSWALVEVSAAP